MAQTQVTQPPRQTLRLRPNDQRRPTTEPRSDQRRPTTEPRSDQRRPTTEPRSDQRREPRSNPRDQPAEPRSDQRSTSTEPRSTSEEPPTAHHSEPRSDQRSTSTEPRSTSEEPPTAHHSEPRSDQRSTSTEPRSTSEEPPGAPHAESHSDQRRTTTESHSTHAEKPQTTAQGEPRCTHRGQPREPRTELEDQPSTSPRAQFRGTASPATENQPPCWRQALPVADATAAQRNPFRTSTKRVRFQDHVEEKPEPSPPLCGTVKSVSHPTEDQVSFQKFCQSLGMELQHTAPYTPRQNPTETANRTIKTMIAQYLDGGQQNEWDQLLPEISLAINSSVSDTTGFSPAFSLSNVPNPLVGSSLQPAYQEAQRATLPAGKARLTPASTQKHCHVFARPPSPQRTLTTQTMDRQGHPPTPAAAPQDTAWMYCAFDDLLQALHGAGPSQPRPRSSLVAHSAGPFRPRALPVEGTTIDDDNVEEANTGNRAGPRRPSTEGMPPLASQHTSPIGTSLLPMEVAHHRGDDEEGVNSDEHARLRPSSARGMPPLVPRHIGLIGPQQAPLEVVHRDDDEEEAHQSDDAGLHPAPLRGMPLQAPLRTGHIGPPAPPPEVAPLNGNDEEEVPRDDRFGPLRVNLTPPQRREAPSGDPAPAAYAEDAWNQAVSLSDDWVNFDRLVEDTLGDLFSTIEDPDEAAIGLDQRGPPHAEPPATGSLGPLGARYDPVTDDEDDIVGTRRSYNPTGECDGDSDATVLYNPTAEDSRDIRRRRTTLPHPSTRRTPPYMGEVEAALVECFGEIPEGLIDWGDTGDNTPSTISAEDEDEVSRDSSLPDASRPSFPATGPTDDESASTISAEEDETSRDSGRAHVSRSPPPSYEEIFGLGPYPGPHTTARCAAVTPRRDPRPRLPTIAELAAEQARRRAEDLREELDIPPAVPPPADGPPPPTPRRGARRRSAPWADSPPSSSDESSLDTDEGAPRWVPAPAEWTTPNGTLPAALLRRIHGRLAVGGGGKPAFPSPGQTLRLRPNDQRRPTTEPRSDQRRPTTEPRSDQRRPTTEPRSDQRREPRSNPRDQPAEPRSDQRSTSTEPRSTSEEPPTAHHSEPRSDQRSTSTEPRSTSEEPPTAHHSEPRSDQRSTSTEPRSTSEEPPTAHHSGAPHAESHSDQRRTTTESHSTHAEKPQTTAQGEPRCTHRGQPREPRTELEDQPSTSPRAQFRGTASPATENQPPCWRQALPVADATAAQRNPFRTSTKRVRFQDHVEEKPEPSPPLCGTVKSVSHPTEDQVSFQKFCQSLGMELQHTAPYTPRQNPTETQIERSRR
ncbi:serine/arginine repetitive matrix protein 2-like [Drosophila kikkawai]|uniref:Serine/arginine repetitive matrix protein 2-like n=1 Tax=Drosophila kikkawai TaxID=30033 RepID=A0ABM4GI83_DROKI